MSEEKDKVLQASGAHALIIGSSVFGIFWGMVNAILVRNTKFE
jgi:hypothetical protein